MLHLLIHWPFFCFFQGRVEDRHHTPDTCSSDPQEPGLMLSKAQDMGFLRTYGKLNKWLNDVKGVMGLSKMCWVHIQFWGPVCTDPIFVSLSLGMPLSCSFMVNFRLVKGLDSATSYQNLTQTPWRLELNGEVPSKELCSEFSLPPSDWFCRGSARVPSAAIKCSLRAEETCPHIY